MPKDNGTFSMPPISKQEKIAKDRILTTPIQQIDVKNNISAADLVENMAGMSIQARNLGMCAQVLKNMLTDKKRPTIFLGLAGPLIAAGLRQVIKDLVTHHIVDAIVSTGAIIYQDIYQARGAHHYRGTPAADDALLHDLRIDRIYDTYVDEEKFWQTDTWCGRIADEMPPQNYSSREYLSYLATKITDQNSIVYQCHKHGVPIFCPALNDSSIGIGLTGHRIRALKSNKKPISIDSIKDNHELVQLMVNSPKTAAIYVAGGVPKNYINDAVVMGYLYGLERGHDYAIQITTAVTADGGLSSSTLGEAQSWGKIDTKASTAFAWVEPSVSLPLLASYIFGKNLGKNRKPLNFKFSNL
jgi:deoxyhypusine synthase